MNALPDRTARISRVTGVKLLFLGAFVAMLAVLDTVHDYVAVHAKGLTISAVAEVQFGLVYWIPYFILGAITVVLVDRYPLSFERASTYLIHGVAGLLFCYVHIVIAAIPTLSVAPELPYSGRFLFRLQFSFAIDYLFYCILVGTTYLLQHYSALKEGEVRASQLEANLAQTHLKAIQAQLNPHFFFNTLQGISVLALADERDAVVEMLGKLSSLLRVSFDKNRPQQISLSSELEFLENYFAIHKLSFGDRLQIKHDIDVETLAATIPAMLLQPLVENCVVHGLSLRPGNCMIRISAKRIAEVLMLEVADSGPGFKSSVPSRTGVGLSSIESKLALLYGSEHSVRYGVSAERGASVLIHIPFSEATAAPRAAIAGGVAA